MVTVYHTFHFAISGMVMWPRAYYSLLIACFLPLVFIMLPHKKGVRRIPWFDFVIMALVIGISLYFFSFARAVEFEAWDVEPPMIARIIGLVFCFIVLESARRTNGLVFAGFCLIFFLYPLFAEYMPTFIGGRSFPFWSAISRFVYGTEALFGIPMKVVGDLLIGFLIFAVALMRTGGGTFFLNLALSLVGGRRGGPAKVAVIASGFFGSMSGSVVANVATTGAITIPAMKNIGYPPHYAGAIEACASTGGVLMPPVMGATAFIMANVLGVDYGQIVIAAAIPSVLYYVSLLMQVDAFAAKMGMKGLPKEDMPSLVKTLKNGWPYLFSLLFLIWGLLYMRWMSLTPFYATALLFATTMLRKETRMNYQGLLQFLVMVGKTIGEIMAIILSVGFIIAALMITGTANAISEELIALTGGNAAFLLLMGALASFILGMGMTVTACYIFLAVTMCPPLVAIGFNALAVHLFVMYYGMLSYITPPVAVGAFTAAGIAGAKPMQTGFTAMRLGAILFILPFFFVLSPALVFQGSLLETLFHFSTLIIGLIFIAGGLEGYLLGVGKVSRKLRFIILITGICISFPFWQPTAIGAALAIVIFLPFFLRKLKVLSKGGSQQGYIR